jgi:chemotaxis protein histidine kinase CheA
MTSTNPTDDQRSSILKSGLLSLGTEGIALLDPKSWTLMDANQQLQLWFPGPLVAQSCEAVLQGFQKESAVLALESGQIYTWELFTRPNQERSIPIEARVSRLSAEQTSALALSADTDSTPYLLVLRNNSRAKEKEFMLKSFSGIIDRNNRLIKQQSKKIETLLHSMRQAIFSIQENGQIVEPVSAYSKVVFGREIEGLSVFDLLFGSIDPNSETLGRIRSAIIQVWDADDVHWVLSAGEFPKRVTFQANSQSPIQKLKVDTLPIWDDNGRLSRILFVVEDVTQVESLEKQVVAQKEGNVRNLQVIQELANMDRSTLELFLLKSADELEHTFRDLQSVKIEAGAIDSAFRRVHTLKGNARTYKLSRISQAAHVLEQTLSELKASADRVATDTTKIALNQLREVRSEFLSYSELAKRIFGIQDDFRGRVLMEIARFLAQIEIKSRGLRSGVAFGLLQQDAHRLKASLRLLHSIKGSFRELGKSSLSEQVHELETLLVSGALGDREIFLNRLRQLRTDFFQQSSELWERSGSILDTRGLQRIKQDLESVRRELLVNPSSLTMIHNLGAQSAGMGCLALSDLFAQMERDCEEKEWVHLEQTREVAIAMIGAFSDLLGLSSSDVLQSSHAVLHALKLAPTLETLADTLKSQVDHHALTQVMFTSRTLEVLTRSTGYLSDTLFFIDLFRILFNKGAQRQESIENYSYGESVPRTTFVLESLYDGIRMELSRVQAVTEELKPLWRMLQAIDQLPASSMVSRLEQVVGDLTNTLDRKVKFQISGRGTSFPRQLLERLQDALLHLLRNSMDHGIERAEEREQAGKPEMGLIQLKFFDTKDGIAPGERKLGFELSDDGRGIDTRLLVLKAIDRKLLSLEDSEGMDEVAKLQLIFIPGLSTATEVTQVSGRGVGMDVVRTVVDQFGGSIQVSSIKEKGTKIRVEFPSPEPI